IRLNPRLNLPSLTSGLTVFHELQRDAIHAVALAGRPRTIVEHVTEVAFTLSTQYFCARHAERLVDLFDNILYLNRRPETRPAGSRIKLLRRAKQRQPAAGALKNPLVVNISQRTRERVLSSLLPQDPVLFGGQLILPFCICLDHFLDSF